MKAAHFICESACRKDLVNIKSNLGKNESSMFLYQVDVYFLIARCVIIVKHSRAPNIYLNIINVQNFALRIYSLERLGSQKVIGARFSNAFQTFHLLQFKQRTVYREDQPLMRGGEF